MAHFNYAKLETYCRLAVQCFEDADDLASQAKAYRSLGSYYAQKRDTTKSAEALSTSLVLVTKAEDSAEQALTMVQLVQHYNLIGDTRAALRYARDAHMHARASGNLWVETGALRLRASTCERMGDYSRGAPSALTPGRLYPPWRSTSDAQTGFSHQETSEGYALINIAYIDIATGKHSTTGNTLNLARSLFSAHNSRFGLVACDITLGDLRCKMGQYAEARQLYLQSFSSLAVAELQTMCLEKLSDVAIVLQEVTSAQRYATLLLVLSAKCGYQAKTHHALRRLGTSFSPKGTKQTRCSCTTLR
ncbi:hypothetical protein MVEN_01392100 [Mycena venus]|uniref:TPR-like protein n=1 Tax=Mycena venus TaxID=2733690 RepID=A0A8H7CUR1_9AGAR|nr:hypothetical protein MVEN_01392100 [Mycena venus]